jgi:Sulfotransferase domain
MTSVKSHLKGLREVKALVKKLPLVERYLALRARRQRHRVERSLLNGTHRNNNDHPSILHFSVNKAATRYTKRILWRCATHNGMVPVSIYDYAFESDLPYLHTLSAAEMQKYQHIFKPAGYLHSVFGEGMVEGIPGLDRYKLILMMRDPRDVLVSRYYSLAYSHPTPPEGAAKYADFMRVRHDALRLSIDEHVLAESDEIYRVYHNYKTRLIDRYANVYVTSYEAMTEDFERWLNGLLNACQLVISHDLRQALLEENARLKPTDEDIYRHLRKGEPGDFQAKLRSVTIDQLNVKFASMLQAFGYAGTANSDRVRGAAGVVVPAEHSGGGDEGRQSS